MYPLGNFFVSQSGVIDRFIGTDIVTDKVDGELIAPDSADSSAWISSAELAGLAEVRFVSSYAV